MTEAIRRISERVRELEGCSKEYSQDIAEIIVRHMGPEDGLECIQKGNFCVYGNCSSMTDVAKELLKGVFSSSFERDFGFDYWAYGRDLETRGTFIRLPGERYLQIF